LFDAAEIQGSQPMRTKSADQPHFTGRSAKQHQIFAEKSNAQRFAARFFEVCRRYYRNPVLAHEISHQSRRANASECFVFLASKVVQVFSAHFEHAFRFHGQFLGSQQISSTTPVIPAWFKRESSRVSNLDPR